ncbi:NAD(P)/FAD-dependent oxidoreductase [Sulfitobacter donghicola]|uniref:FAD dependent oxidoreductase n=1 Tax=Sulfitobacter donghicola DSW-25 = KCTC 12864 = JCM 14565 TaxID=1300350 RepID=A0A073ILG4_9RHOB|nr:FAD-dependent oxidoreductase [Sulfitobacter donghicola]KEJ90564.1 FAD dependent oxidoreductase [Sulfitobacter donghicola DSW-25 = KCTC 12864 = JCM 14565]KIN67811.1 FAD dependent oxidoreductase [Sulfitobacter donghicola DSW-25 = KCTC 12864 = JCM 14565]
MRRLFNEYAYGEGPRETCWWDETCDIRAMPTLGSSGSTDVAIIGAGFTGLTAALHLARAGINVTVLEAKTIGWGASGRNGGFCCLGGSMASDQALDRRFGRSGRIEMRRTELAAVEFVDDIITQNQWNVDRHSKGETVLAHRQKHMDGLKHHAQTVAENYGVPSYLHGASDLAELGMAGPFYGGMTVEAGFALNPRKYLSELAGAAISAGAKIFESSTVAKLEKLPNGWSLGVNGFALHADRVIIGTNGYSSEDVPRWLAGRYMPSQSNVIVTRPLTEAEVGESGWTTDQMSFDTRNLLHYFRLLPDRRMLFGMRGGLKTGAKAEDRMRSRIRKDFGQMFPAFREIPAQHAWSGMVCLSRSLLPFVGAVPQCEGLFAGMCYHGNGIAMGSYSGALLAQLAQHKKPDAIYPKAMQEPLPKFELGRWRRAMMPIAYAALGLADC